MEDWRNYVIFILYLIYIYRLLKCRMSWAEHAPRMEAGTSRTDNKKQESLHFKKKDYFGYFDKDAKVI
jgi:hypothetical protein